MKIKNFMKTIPFIIIIILGIISCEKAKDENPKRQLVYFEYYGISYSWGFNYAHWIIDNEGNVRINHNPDSIFTLNVNRIDSCMSYFDSIVYKVDPSEFKKYSNLIKPASLGNYDCEPAPTPYGEGAYYCLQENTFIVLFSQFQGTICTNVDTSARQILNWLMDQNIKLYSKKSLPAANK